MQEINLKTGEMEITTNHGLILVAPGLGSCIGLAVYDKKSRIAGMAHIVLPDSSINYGKDIDINEEFGKYVDTAVPAILERMLSLGSKKDDLIIKIAGGANIYNFKEDSSLFNIGERNVQAAEKAVKDLNLSITKADTGGNKGRILKLNVMNGIVYLKTAKHREVIF